MKFDTKKLTHFPEKPGVYLMKDADQKVLYVGKAKLLKERIKQYFAKGGDQRAMIPFLIQQITHIETIVTFTEKEALLLENTLIKKHKPKYNVLLKDDKTYLSIKINNRNKWPMVKLVRFKGSPKNDALYFGPYTSALAARETYDTITKVFPLRQCSDRELVSRKRPCLLYSIKRCIAPCVDKCSQEDYTDLVDQTIKFLKGKNTEILQRLKQQVKHASNQLQYERAGALQRTINQIEEIIKVKKSSVQTKVKECDAISFIRRDNLVLVIKLTFRQGRLTGFEHFDFSLIVPNNEDALQSFLLQHYGENKPPHEVLLPFKLDNQPIIEEILGCRISTPIKGDKKQLIELAEENAKAILEQMRESATSNEDLLFQMQEKLSLSRLPTRIECFDTSNTTGSDPVASMVVFTDGKKDTKRYRLYKIKEAAGSDDYAALNESLTRRLKRAKSESDLPDLIIVDGGKGQLSTAQKVLTYLNIVSVDVISFVKEAARHDKGLTKERIFIPGKSKPISLDPHSSLLFLLQRIRDEAHRKAITFHRKNRTKRGISSFLDSIQGIGPVKKRHLLKYFGSVKRIKEASLEELQSVENISKADAVNLRDHFKISQ